MMMMESVQHVTLRHTITIRHDQGDTEILKYRSKVKTNLKYLKSLITN